MRNSSKFGAPTGCVRYLPNFLFKRIYNVEQSLYFRQNTTVFGRCKAGKSLAWCHAGTEQLANYSERLGILLDEVCVPAEAAICDNTDRCEHGLDIAKYYKAIFHAVFTAAKASIPAVRHRKIRRPHWNHSLRDEKRIALMNYRQWKCAGKPREGFLYEDMCKSRKNFKRCLKKWKHEEAQLLGRKLLDELDNGNQAKFWEKLKRGSSESGGVPDSLRIGHASSVPEILNLWRDHFDNLLNSQDKDMYSKHKEEYLKDLKEFEKAKGGDVWKLRVSMSEVNKAIAGLSLKKVVGTDCIAAEHIKYGGGVLALHLSTLFQAMLRHSFVPSEFREAVVIPIVKDRNKDAADPDNYRGIAVASVVSKLFERVILMKWENCLRSSDLQFGFSKGIGCAECSHVVLETIDHYLGNGSNGMIACGLDLSKAYDRVSHYGLLCKLIKRGLPVAVVKLLESWCTQQLLRVKWDGQLSEPVGVSNGVRQGSVLSPLLFNVVMDDLLVKLRESGNGAKVGGIFVGSVAYADDLLLLSPTVNGMQCMLDVCSNFVEENCMRFNVQKCAVVVISKKPVSKEMELLLCGHIVPTVDQIVHLGSVIKGNRDSVAPVNARIGKFYGAANAVVGKLGLICREEEVWRQVVMKQLLPVLNYGSHRWNFSSRKVCSLVNSAWRRVIRKGLGIRQRESVRQRVGDWFQEASDMMKRQQLLFFHKAIHSISELVVTVTLTTRNSSRIWKSIDDGNIDPSLLFVLSYKQMKQRLYNN